MWLCGNAVDYLARETDAYLASVVKGRMADETVVETAAASEPVAMAVECHARHSQ